jgi:hypothetical protein
MPNPLKILLLLCASAVTVPKITAQECASRTAPGWSTELRQLYADCENTVQSPDRSISFRVGFEEQIGIVKSGHSLNVLGGTKLSLPAVVSWSPNSTSFFLNDGEGSGMASQLRFFRVGGTTVIEDGMPNRSIIRIYRQSNRCGATSVDPNVFGIGWSKDGTALYAIAQSTVNEPCGRPDQFLGFVISANTLEIKKVLSARRTRAQLARFLPPELLRNGD